MLRKQGLGRLQQHSRMANCHQSDLFGMTACSKLQALPTILVCPLSCTWYYCLKALVTKSMLSGVWLSAVHALLVAAACFFGGPAEP
jgi:hypothetical protein